MKPFFLVTMFLCSIAQAWPQNTALQADSTLSLSEKLLQSLGGKQLWKETKSLHIKENMWPKQLPEIVTQEIWRNLDEHGTRIHLSSESMDRVRAGNASQGWGILETGRIYVYDSLRIKNERRAWESNLLTICHKMANDDPNLVITEKEGGLIEVSSSSNQPICTIELNAKGEPIKWSSAGDDETESYIYGPLKSFGKYRLPSWWTSEDGHWQFEYITFKGSSEKSKVSFLPPKNFSINNQNK